jgi:hypothetical protein
VLDHGSDDGSTDALGVTVERMRRSTLDEDARAALISDCVRELLRSYDAVIHSDADELLIADPARYANLQAYAAGAAAAETAIGLDLQHLPAEEAALEPDWPLGTQRQWVRFSGAMCKPALVRQPVRWTPGFHDCDAERCFGKMYLVHLRYADLAAGLRRLARSRELQFARADANPHQRVTDETFEEMVRAIASLPRVDGKIDALISPYMTRMMAGWAAGESQLSLSGDALWRLPASLRSQI